MATNIGTSGWFPLTNRNALPSDHEHRDWPTDHRRVVDQYRPDGCATCRHRDGLQEYLNRDVRLETHHICGRRPWTYERRDDGTTVTLDPNHPFNLIRVCSQCHHDIHNGNGEFIHRMLWRALPDDLRHGAATTQSDLPIPIDETDQYQTLRDRYEFVPDHDILPALVATAFDHPETFESHLGMDVVTLDSGTVTINISQSQIRIHQ